MRGSCRCSVPASDVQVPLRIEDSRHQWFRNSKSSVSPVAPLLKRLLPLFVVEQGLRVVCLVRGDTNAAPFLTDKQMHETLTRTLTQTRCMLQNYTLVFILRFFLGFAFAAGGLFPRAGGGPRWRWDASGGRCSACSCTSSVRLISL